MKPRSRGWRNAAAVALLIPVLAGCERARESAPAASDSDTASLAASYVGGDACVACHAQQAKLWGGSHHDLAMQPAEPATVLGNFDNATFTKDGVTSTFLRRDTQYFVRADDADGKLAEFRVTHTFGVEPLQQYLLEYPRGRLQALSIAWDARPKEQGGQRWFHLYPNEKIDHRDELHWTAPAQNWNHMCAECHSTNLQKNYRAAEDRFETRWTDIAVSCEACHGPGSRHVAWAQSTEKSRAEDPARGLVFQLADRPSGSWAFVDGSPIAQRTRPLASHAELETCGRCHSRRGQIWSEYHHGEPLAQTHRVALLDEHLYHPDGQIQDEVYEYGSFLQSRMFAAGVTCSDCHDPHSGQLRASGNAVCTQCHQAAAFDSSSHHFHPAQSDAGRCIACHMIERQFMLVDGRRDHSFRVPRPDLTTTLGTPNACNDCHRDKKSQWAADAVAKWYGTERRQTNPHAAALHAGRNSHIDAETQLMRVVGNRALSGIVRATAISLLPPYLSPQSLPIVVNAVADEDPLVRRAVAEVLTFADGSSRLTHGMALLRDPVRTVRLEALGALLDLPRSQFTSDQLSSLDSAIAEYRQVQDVNADRAEAQVNLGMLEARLGNAAAAQAAYERAIQLQPSFMPSHVNLADLYRAQGREDETERTLRSAIEINRYDAAVHEALGLSLVRQRRLREAVNELAHAAQLRPDVARYAYVQAIALRETGVVASAVHVLEAAHARHPSNREIVVALVEFNIERGDRRAAMRWARTLLTLSPDEPRTRAILKQLEDQSPSR